jgi:integrase
MYEDALIDMKKNKKLSDNTLVSYHSCMKLIFKRAKSHNLLKINPTDDAELPKTMKTVQDLEERVEIPKYLEKDELQLFLKTAQEEGLYGDYETFLTLSYTGMRIGELIPLKVSDVDFTENTVSITKTYFNERSNINEYKLLTPKTKTSIRVIEMDPLVTTVIKNYIQENKRFIMMHRRDYYDKGYIFPNMDKYKGYPNLHVHYQKRMKRLLKLAGLNTNLSIHSLRHTHTSLLAEGGIPLQEIMDRLGHSDDTVTKTVYLHVTKSRKKEASRKFGEIMNS